MFNAFISLGVSVLLLISFYLFRMLFLILITAIKIAIFDAGSTGTRLKIYTFQGSSLESQDIFKSQQNKGIHEMNTTEIEDTITKLLSQGNVSNEDVVGFYGTAGLRSADEKTRNRVIGKLKSLLNGHRTVDVAVMSGLDEALYSSKAYEFLKSAKNQYCLIDMGGRSVQIVQRNNLIYKLASLDLGILNSKCNESKEGFLETFYGKLKNLFGSSSKLTTFFSVDKKHQSSSLTSDFLSEKLLTTLFSVDKKHLKCIDDFFDRSLDFTIDKTDEIYLMSYYEDILRSGEQKSLKQLVNDFNWECTKMSDPCSKMYYSIKFLNRIGIHEDQKLRIINDSDRFDMSWPLGKAVEIYESIVNENSSSR